MIKELTSSLDRRTWERLMLYIDIIMFFVAVVSLISLVLNIYDAGYNFGGGDTAHAQKAMFYVAGSVAFLTFSMAWIFVRFFRNKLGYRV